MSSQGTRLAVLGFLLAPASALLTGDVPKSADHPLIKRYEGSTIVRYSQKEFEEFNLTTGPVVAKGSEARFPKQVKLEGRVTRITYLVPVGRSPLEVVRNYETELKAAGFTTLFAGGHEALGQGKFDSAFAEASYRDIDVPSFSGTNFSMLVSKDDSISPPGFRVRREMCMSRSTPRRLPRRGDSSSTPTRPIATRPLQTAR